MRNRTHDREHSSNSLLNFFSPHFELWNLIDSITQSKEKKTVIQRRVFWMFSTEISLFNSVFLKIRRISGEAQPTWKLKLVYEKPEKIAY